MDKITLYNLALAEIGSQVNLTSENDPQNELTVCEMVFDSAMRELMSEYPWHSARRFADLNKLQKSGHIRFKNGFQLPNDLISVVETEPSRIPFEIADRIIYSDSSYLKIAYTALPGMDSLAARVAALLVLKVAIKILPVLRKGSTADTQLLHQKYAAAFTAATGQEVRESFTRPRAAWWINEL